MPTIGLAMIVKEWGEGLERCLASVYDHVDQVVVVVTQSKQTSIPKEFNKVQIEYFDWIDDFAAARNYSFSFLNTDWLFWLDDDDTVTGADKLHRVVEESEQVGIGCIHLQYDYRHDSAGNVTVTQNRERLMKASLGWLWRDRVHEWCSTQSEHMVGFSADVKVVHSTNEANRERNLQLLQLMEQEDPDNIRLAPALADTYQSMGEHEKAIFYAEKAFETITQEDVRWTTATELARSHQFLKNWTEVERWCYAAISIHPEYALPYLLLAHMYWFGYQDSDRAALFLKDADEREEAPLTVYRQPEDYTIRRWDVEHRILADKGQWREALNMVDRVMLQIPEDQQGQWQYYHWYYLERMKSETSVQAAYDLIDHLCRRGDTLNAWTVINSLPVSIREDGRIEALKARIWGFVKHVLTDEDAYQAFYEAGHSEVTNDNNNLMNAVTVETYRMDPLIQRLKKHGAKRVLDVGCGAGEPALYLAEHGFYVTGLDINAHAVKEARKRAKQRFPGKHNLQRPDFRQGTFDTVGPEDIGKFDAVVMMELIEHIHPSKVRFYLASAEDFLNPNGAVYLTTPGMLVGDIPGVGSEFPRDHVKEFTRADLEGFLVEPASKRERRPLSLFKLYDPPTNMPGFASWFMEYEVKKPTDADPPEWDQPVVLYIGPAHEQWDPQSPEIEGIGGSETWAAKVARELRAKGHPVIVYAEIDGVWDGVIYRHYNKWQPKAPFAGQHAWLTVISRQTDALDERPDSDHVFFVAHDIDYGEEITAARLANIDRYCTMSEWHQGFTAELYKDADFFSELVKKLAVIPNGIEPEYFLHKTPEKVPHSFIWSSSADRGLHKLLEWWPEIRDMWPDATLRIFYGWNNVDVLAQRYAWLLPYKAKIEEMVRQPGVEWVGRINQKQLAEEMLKTQFWLYPSLGPDDKPWLETFCITAVEAQAAGVVPLMPAYGALPERLEYGWMSDDFTLPKVLDALQAWDEQGERFQFDREEFISRYSWAMAAEKLLDVVPVKSLA